MRADFDSFTCFESEAQESENPPIVGCSQFGAYTLHTTSSVAIPGPVGFFGS